MPRSSPSSACGPFSSRNEASPANLFVPAPAPAPAPVRGRVFGSGSGSGGLGRGMRFRVLFGLAAIVGVAMIAASACTTRVAHTFGAYRFEKGVDPAHDCLQGSAAVDVIDGPDPGVCSAVRCWVSPGKEVYITST